MKLISIFQNWASMSILTRSRARYSCSLLRWRYSGMGRLRCWRGCGSNGGKGFLLLKGRLACFDDTMVLWWVFFRTRDYWWLTHGLHIALKMVLIKISCSLETRWFLCIWSITPGTHLQKQTMKYFIREWSEGDHFSSRLEHHIACQPNDLISASSQVKPSILLLLIPVRH